MVLLDALSVPEVSQAFWGVKSLGSRETGHVRPSTHMDGNGVYQALSQIVRGVGILWLSSIPMSTGPGIGARPVLKLQRFFRGVELGLKLKPTRAEFRGTLLSLIGIAITILFIKGSVALWKTEYGWGSLFLAAGAGLTFAFFRKWKADLVIIGLVFIGINTGLTAVFHPSVPGILITVASGVGIVVLARWMAGHPRQG